MKLAQEIFFSTNDTRDRHDRSSSRKIPRNCVERTLFTMFPFKLSVGISSSFLPPLNKIKFVLDIFTESLFEANQFVRLESSLLNKSNKSCKLLEERVRVVLCHQQKGKFLIILNRYVYH